jgi:putative serine protease PepD
MDTIEVALPVTGEGWSGVLLDEQGKVTGILERQAGPPDQAVGVFVPAPLALGVAEEIETGLPVRHGWIGVQGNGNADVASGAAVASVVPGGPADVAGLRSGDVVRSIDGVAVSSFADLEARLYVLPPGTAVSLDIHRAQTDRQVVITLAGWPS